MQIPVLIETLPNGRGFRARAGEPFEITAESPDRTGAIDEVRRQLDALIISGQVVPIDVGGSNPTAKLIGTLDMSDPRAQQWWAHVEEFRRECDNLTLPGEESENGG
jgi:hypothetical protein